MSEKIKPLRLWTAIILTAAAGLLLKYFDLSNYIIILGFRFHLSFILPFLFVITRIPGEEIKKIFSSPEYKKDFEPIIWLLTPVIITAALYAADIILIADPEYFYEFGLSSLVDYPLYLIWNFPHFAALFIFLHQIGLRVKKKFLIILISILALFSYEFYPFDISEFNYSGILGLILISAAASFLLKYFSNIYWFTIIIFTTLWSSFLLAGSSSATIINILFAARYKSWEGFISGGEIVNIYFVPVYGGILLITILITVIFRKRYSSNSD